jgi:hypothetical protein
MNLLYGLLAAIFPPRCERTAELVPGRRALIRGRVVPRDAIDSPLTGERCVYYRYAVEEWRQSGMAGLGSGGFWEMQEQDEAITEFYLQDATGRVIVSPDRARVQARAGFGPEAVDMGIFTQRAQQLMIRGGDAVEIEGIVALASDIHDRQRSYRASAERFLICAPEGEALSIRVLAPDALNRDEISEPSGGTSGAAAGR